MRASQSIWAALLTGSLITIGNALAIESAVSDHAVRHDPIVFAATEKTAFRSEHNTRQGEGAREVEFFLVGQTGLQDSVAAGYPKPRVPAFKGVKESGLTLPDMQVTIEPSGLIRSDTGSTTDKVSNVQSAPALCLGRCVSYEPSIFPLAGGQSQFRRGERYTLNYPYCAVQTFENPPRLIQALAGSAKLTWTPQLGFGGHQNTHSPLFPPAGRFLFKGQAVGSFTFPFTSVRSHTFTISFTAAEAEANFRQLFGGGLASTPVPLRLSLPEVATDVFHREEVTCQLNGEPRMLEPREQYVRTEMNLPLLEAPDAYESSNSGRVNNRRARLAIERGSANSHGDFNGWASGETDAKLRGLVEDYGQCLDGPGKVSAPDANLLATAISLPRGGLFDVSKNWHFDPGGHKTHRAGENVDIGFGRLRAIGNPNHIQRHLECLFIAINMRFDMNEATNRIVDNGDGTFSMRGNHVHLWSRDAHLYPLDQTNSGFNNNF